MYYKVVLNSGGSYYSSQVFQSLRQEYLVDTWAKPSIGKLFIFKTQNEAIAYVGSPAGALEVWECEARGVIEPFYVLDALTVNMSADPLYLEQIRNLWDNMDAGIESPLAFGSLMRPPVGTLLADEVKLLRLAP